MGDWKTHGSATGGYYKCNVYEKKLQSDKGFSDEEKKRDEAKNELERYTFYFQRYDSHDKAMTYAQKIKPTLDDKINMLVQIKNYNSNELKFLIEGCAIVIQSRNVLKCSYAYAYYNK
jgi:ariadne-1